MKAALTKSWTMLPALFLVCTLLGADRAGALPFNDDMVLNPNKTGRIMRPLPKDSLAVGSSAYHVPSKSEAMNAQNPIKGDAGSVARGDRLFHVNCAPCHGDISSKEWSPGPAGQKFLLKPPDITVEQYKKVTDGYLFATIHFGGLVVMPPLGMKLSPIEHWDIVNYVRKVQESK